MAMMTFEALRSASEVFLSQWSVLNVPNEPLLPAGKEGLEFISTWDNWLLPEDDQRGIEPLVIVDGYAVDRGDGYTVVKSGDSVRGRIRMSEALGPDAIVLATFYRSMFRNIFWQNAIRTATNEIYNRLLMSPPTFASGGGMDMDTSPWHIVVKQVGKDALVNLQMFLAGLGRSQVEGVVMDLSRAHTNVDKTIGTLKEDIDRDVVAWRHVNSPLGRRVSRSWQSYGTLGSLRGPGPTFYGMYVAI